VAAIFTVSAPAVAAAAAAIVAAAVGAAAAAVAGVSPVLRYSLLIH
jgi:hypothetical protein